MLSESLIKKNFVSALERIFLKVVCVFVCQIFVFSRCFFRYDCRLFLTDLSQYEQPSTSKLNRAASPPPEDAELEEELNEERYKDTVEFLK